MAHDPRCTVIEAHSDPDCIIPGVRGPVVWGVVVRPDHSHVVLTESPSLDVLQGYVGGNIEALPSSIVPIDATLFVHEEPGPSTAFNSLAHHLVGMTIVGPLIVAGLPDEEGELTPLDPLYARFAVAWAEMAAHVAGLAEEG